MERRRAVIWLSAFGGTAARTSAPWEPLVKMRPLEMADGGWKDRSMPAVYQTQMQLISSVFRQDWEHKYAYDEETLTHVLRQAGFSQVIRQRFRNASPLPIYVPAYRCSLSAPLAKRADQQ